MYTICMKKYDSLFYGSIQHKNNLEQHPFVFIENGLHELFHPKYTRIEQKLLVVKGVQRRILDIHIQ